MSIEKFLENHTEYYLSDVYYKQSVWDNQNSHLKYVMMAYVMAINLLEYFSVNIGLILK